MLRCCILPTRKKEQLMSLLFTRPVRGAASLGVRPQTFRLSGSNRNTLSAGVCLALALLCGSHAGAQGRAQRAAPLASEGLPALLPGHTTLAGDLLIGLEDGANDRAFQDQIGHLGQITGHSSPLRTYRVRLNAGMDDALALQWLRHQTGVAYAENNHRVQIASTPNDASYAAQYAPSRIKADLAWGAWQPQGQVIVAVVDTGTDYTHPDLANVMLRDTQGNVIGHDSTGSNSFLDGYGHGTHVTGIVGAQINNGASFTDSNGNKYGTAGMVGWNGIASLSDTSHVKIMPVRVLDSSGSGSDAEVADGIVWAADHGARVISMSLGEPDDPGSPGPPVTLNAAVQYAWKKGAVIVAAAGNSSTNTFFYPAALPNVISVAATDQNDVMAYFSNYGSWVTTAAPGVNILSTFATYATGPNWGTNYGYLSGTSMATPHVAAEAALLFAQKLGLTNQQVHDLIISNTDPIAGGQGIASGAGRINYIKALGQISTFNGLTGLFNTGLDSSGNPLADSASDPHYTLVSTPSGAPGSAVVTQQHFPIGGGLWMPDTATSKWISPHADESVYSDLTGTYTYQTTFTVGGDPTSAEINGGVAGDDQVTSILLNGKVVAMNISGSIQSLAAFTISSGFVSGLNTLQFVVTNSGSAPNPSGFRCELTGTAQTGVAAAVPAAPAGLTATPGNAQVTLKWTPPVGATSYNVKRSASLSGPFVTVATLVGAASYTDSNANYDGTLQTPNGTPVYYVVTAMNTLGESAASSAAGATPKPNGVGSIAGLFSTGLDGSGNPLADGVTDAHYSLVSAPGGTGGAPFVTLQHFPIGNGLWMPDTATSKWISPIADEQKYTDAPGNYTYQTTFTVYGDPTAVQIACQLAGDDTVSAIVLNGKTIATNLANDFTTFKAYTINSGFVAGANTLQFIVSNLGTSANPTGFRCELKGTQGAAAASVTGLFNTGLDGSGNAVADSASDPHYTLVSAPSTGGSALVTQQKFPIGGGVWLEDTAVSKWISPHADESAYPDAPGNYTYQTTFTITGDVTTVKINGKVLGDDQVAAIILNGTVVAKNISNSFQKWTQFTLSTGLVSGANTVQFVVYNSPYNNPNGTQNNPSGFRCEMNAGSR